MPWWFTFARPLKCRRGWPPHLVLWLAAVACSISTSAFANRDCSGFSGADESACLMKGTAKAEATMRRNYDRAIDAAKAMLDSELKDPAMGIHPDFRAQVAEDQKRWKSWAEHECGSEGDFIMGTGGTLIEIECRKRLALDRTRMLNAFTQQFQSLTPQNK